jgi:hypothetical protein
VAKQNGQILAWRWSANVETGDRLPRETESEATKRPLPDEYQLEVELGVAYCGTDVLRRPPRYFPIVIEFFFVNDFDSR